MKKLPDAPKEYSREWANQFLRQLETELKKMAAPIAFYTAEGNTVSRDISDTSDLAKVVATLDTLIKDLKTRGILS